MKVRTFDGPQESYIAWQCPGCAESHHIPISGPGGWAWNGDRESPTITPSVLRHTSPGGGLRCHCFIAAGQVQFCADCDHALAGQTIPIPDIQEQS